MTRSLITILCMASILAIATEAQAAPRVVRRGPALGRVGVGFGRVGGVRGVGVGAVGGRVGFFPGFRRFGVGIGRVGFGVVGVRSGIGRGVSFGSTGLILSPVQTILVPTPTRGCSGSVMAGGATTTFQSETFSSSGLILD